MNTVFGYIVQEHLSHKHEDVATDTLDFILRSSESARRGFVKFLRKIEPGLPKNLFFRTQPAKERTRPDMCGSDGRAERVFIENKFWADLTPNQPANYLQRLANNPPPTMLLVVVPAAGLDTMWSKLCQRAKVSNSTRHLKTCNVWRVKTGRGRILALTSWNTLLSAIKSDPNNEKQTMSNLLQLSDLCDVAGQSFVPISSQKVKDIQIPGLILQLNSIVEYAVSKSEKGVVSTKNPNEKNPKKGKLLPQHSWNRVGRYICFPGASSVGSWFGTEFALWKHKGETPLWLVFEDTKWQRGREVRDILEAWAKNNQIPVNWWRNVDGYDEFAVGIRLVPNKDEAAVITSVVNQLKVIATKLSKISRKQK